MTAGNLLAFGDVRVDLAAERVWRAGELVELEPKAFEVLRYLLDNPERLISKQELFDTVWERTAVTDNALTRVVAQLRRALGDDARDARYVETVPTRGYRFIARIERLAGDAAAGASARRLMTDAEGAGSSSSPAGGAADRALAVGAAPGASESDGSGVAVDGAATRNVVGEEVTSVGPSSSAEAEPVAAWQRLWRSRSLTAAVIGGVIVVAGYALLARWDRPADRSELSALNAAVEAKDLRGPVTQVTFSLDLDSYPSFSPDGTMLAYASLQESKLDLFVRSFVAGSSTRQVTNDGQQNVQPDWSPDGQYLVYHSIARGGLWVVPSTGGTVRQFVDVGSAPRWSPDGRSVVYQSSELHSLDQPTAIAPGTLWIATFPDGERRRLTTPDTPVGGHSQPAWSSDGKRIVFVAQYMGPSEIWSIDVASGALTRVMTCPWTCATPVLDIDGRALFYAAPEPHRGVWRMPLTEDGRAAAEQAAALFTPIDSDVQGLAIPRDGSRLAFTMQTVRSNLESIDVSAQFARATPTSASGTRTSGASSPSSSSSPPPRPRPVTRDTSVRNTWPIVSPDGSKLAYMSRRSGVGRQIWVAEPDGTNPRQVTFDSTTGPLHTWMPDGDALAYLSMRNRRIDMLTTSLTTGRVRELHSFGPRDSLDRVKLMHARFTPDVRQIVVSQVSDGVMNLWIQPLQPSAAPRRLTHDRESAGFPTVSPDGRWVAYEVMRGGDAHLAVVPTEGGEERVLTSGRGLYWPHSFAPDGDRIAVAYRLNGLWRLGAISRTSGRLDPLSDPVPANMYVRYPAWTGPTDRLVYEHAQVTGNVWMATLRSGRAATHD